MREVSFHEFNGKFSLYICMYVCIFMFVLLSAAEKGKGRGEMLLASVGKKKKKNSFFLFNLFKTCNYYSRIQFRQPPKDDYLVFTAR